MSKIKTTNLEPRTKQGTLTIGTNEGPSTTRFEGAVVIPGYASNEYVEDLIEGNIAVELKDYQTRSEKGIPDGYAPLGDDARVEPEHLNTDIQDYAIYELDQIAKKHEKQLQDLESAAQFQIEYYMGHIDGAEPQASYMSINNPAWSGVTEIKLHKIDGKTAEHDYTEINVGSTVWFSGTKSENIGVYEINAVEHDGDVTTLTVDPTSSQGSPEVLELIEIQIFPIAGVHSTISTTPPDFPKDGDFWYDNTEEEMQLMIFHEESDAWIAAAPPSTLDSRVAAGEALQAQIGEAVVDLQSDKLTKTGDDMYGSFYATGGNHLRFYGKDSNDRNKTFIDLVNTNGQGTEGTDFYLKLYHVATPSSPYHAANQKYVDDSIGALVIPEAPNLTELEQKVDSMLTEAEIRAIVNSHGATPILWKYNLSAGADSLANGEFTLSSGLSSGSADEWSIYFAERDARGQRWYPHDSGNEYTHEVGDQMATIREKDAIICHGKTTKWYFNQGTNNYARMKLTYYRSQFAKANGKWYMINIPGYMPLFQYSSNSYSNGTHS